MGVEGVFDRKCKNEIGIIFRISHNIQYSVFLVDIDRINPRFSLKSTQELQSLVIAGIQY